MERLKYKFRVTGKFKIMYKFRVKNKIKVDTRSV